MKSNHAAIYTLCLISVLTYCLYIYISIDTLFWIDESFYLNSIRYPEKYNAVVTLFGHILKPLFFLTGFNIVIFRILGVFVLLAVSFLFTVSLLKIIESEFVSENHQIHPDFRIIVFPLLLSSLHYYGTWHGFTPGYYWLNLVGLLLGWSGLLQIVHMSNLSKKKLSQFEKVLWFLCVGVGLFLSGASKPTTGVIFSIFVVLIFRINYPGQWIRYSFVIALCVLLQFLCLSLAYYSNPLEIITILRNGAELFSGTSHGITAITSNFANGVMRFPMQFVPNSIFNEIFSQPVFVVFVIFLIFTTAFIAFKASITTSAQSRRLNIILYIFLLSELVFLVARLIKNVLLDLPVWTVAPQLSLFLIWAMFLLVISVIKDSNHNQNELYVTKMSSKVRFTTLFLGLTPFAYAFGTDAFLLGVAMGASIFLVSVIFIVIMFKRRNLLPVFSVSLLLLTVASGWIQYPLSWSVDLTADMEEIVIGDQERNMRVFKAEAVTLNSLREIADSKRFQYGTGVVDFIGSRISSGYIYVLGGYPVGWPATSPRSGGLFSFVDRVLQYVSTEELSCSWIMAKESDLDKVEVIYEKRGLNFRHDYQELAKGDVGDSITVWQPLLQSGTKCLMG